MSFAEGEDEVGADAGVGMFFYLLLIQFNANGYSSLTASLFLM